MKQKISLLKVNKIIWSIVAFGAAFDYFFKIVGHKNNFEFLVATSLMAILSAILRLIELKEKDLKHKQIIDP